MTALAVPLGPKTHLVFLTVIEMLFYFDRGFMSGAQTRLQDAKVVDSEDNTGVLATLLIVGFMVGSPIFAATGRRSATHAVRVILIGCAIWVSAMILGFFKGGSLGWLSASRFLSGVGQAGFLSFAPAMIDLSAPVDKSSTYLGIYFTALYLGAALGTIIGGADFFKTWDEARYTYLVLAACMIPLACMMFIWRNRFLAPSAEESPRRASLNEPVAEPLFSKRAQIKAVLSSKAFLASSVGYGFLMFYIGGLAYWGPTMVENIFNLTRADSTFYFGACTVASGIVGTLLGSLANSKAIASVSSKPHHLTEDGIRAVVSNRLSCLMILSAFPFCLTCLFMESSAVFFAIVFMAELLLFASTAPVNVALMAAVAEQHRGQAVALSVMIAHALGDVPSPYIIGFAVKPEFWGYEPDTNLAQAHRYALLLCTSSLILTSVAWLVAVRFARKEGIKKQVEGL